MAWRLIVARAIGDKYLDMFAAEIGQTSRYIGKAGQLSATIKVADKETADRLRKCTESDATLALYLAHDETLWWGGLLDKDSINGKRAELTVNFDAASFESYPDRREARRNQATTTKDQLDWARIFWQESTKEPDADLAITYPPLIPSGVLRENSFKDEDSKYWGSMLATMANRDNGFDWVIDVTGTPWDRKRTLILAYPSLDRGTEYTIPASAISDYTETRDRTSGALSWRVRGEAPEGSNGKDVPAPMSDVFEATGALAVGAVRTDRTASRSGVSDKVTLNSYAKHYRDALNGTGRLLDVTCDLAAIDPGVLGALVRVRLVDLMHPALADGTPTMDQARRCIGYTLQPAKRGQKASVKLTFEEPGGDDGD